LGSEEAFSVTEHSFSDIMEALRKNESEHMTFRDEISSLKSEVGELRTEVGKLNRKVDVLDRKVGELDRKVDALSGAVNDLSGQVRKLGLDFEQFRHDTRITLEAILDLKVRTNGQEKLTASLDRRMTRVERHLDLLPLDEGG